MPLVKNTQVLPLLQPVTPDNPVGAFDEEEDLYTKLDDEMIKLGGLQNATINWEGVEQNAKTYLINHCKHLRVTNYLAQCWLRKNTWDLYRNTCDLTTGFCEQYFVDAYPNPGKKGLALKHKIYALLINGLKSSLDTLTSNQVDKEILPEVIQSISYLQSVSQKIQCTDEVLNTIGNLHKKLQNLLKTPTPPVNKSASTTGSQGGQAINSQFFTSSQNIPASINNERELRKTLIALAQTANQHDAYDPVGYLLRRYALWGPITSSPITVKGSLTELMPVPSEIMQEYQNALDTNKIDPSLLQKVENSVSSSIYWFKGSYFACQYAKRLEMEEVSNAIWNATTRFVTRLPILLKLQFKDGSPFADEETTEWITTPITSTAQPASQTLVDTDYLKLYKQLSKQMEKEGVESVLQILEKQQNRHLSLRQQCQYMKVTADLLNERKLSWLAKEFYQRIEQTMNVTHAAQWEPDLYAQVSMTKTEPEPQDNNKGNHQP